MNSCWNAICQVFFFKYNGLNNLSYPECDSLNKNELDIQFHGRNKEQCEDQQEDEEYDNKDDENKEDEKYDKEDDENKEDEKYDKEDEE